MISKTLHWSEKYLSPFFLISWFLKFILPSSPRQALKISLFFVLDRLLMTVKLFSFRLFSSRWNYHWRSNRSRTFVPNFFSRYHAVFQNMIESDFSVLLPTYLSFDRTCTSCRYLEWQIFFLVSSILLWIVSKSFFWISSFFSSLFFTNNFFYVINWFPSYPPFFLFGRKGVMYPI